MIPFDKLKKNEIIKMGKKNENGFIIMTIERIKEEWNYRNGLASKEEKYRLKNELITRRIDKLKKNEII